MATPLVLPFIPVLGVNATVESGAKLYAYEPATLTPKNLWTNAALSVAHAVPVVADSDGRFAAIYLDPAETYRLILKTSAGVTIDEIDDFAMQDTELRNELAESDGPNLIGFNTAETFSVGSLGQALKDLTEDAVVGGSTDLGTLAAGATINNSLESTFIANAGGTSDFRNFIFKSTLTGANGADKVIDQNFQTELRHTAGTVTYGYGIQGYNRLGLAGSTTGAVTTMRGVEWHIANEGTGNITDAFTFYAEGIDLADGTGTVATLNSFRSGDIGHATRLTTASYGFFQANATAGPPILASYGSEMSAASGKWGLYFTGGANNFMAGALRLGGATAAPTNRLEVVGKMLAYTESGVIAGIGFGTSAGGAVTQITSRTTGVTLNKPCGAITLVSAAGTASWQSFTVTNDTVGANDTIRVCQKSGTDKNMIHVTAVGAGSFEITFATTGGTTTEQPVFNFTVMKGVVA